MIFQEDIKMANICGLDFKAAHSWKNDDKSASRISSLYVENKKVATILEETGVEGCEDSVQIFMMPGFSEAGLRRALEEKNGEDRKGYSIEDAIQDLQWLSRMEHDFHSHGGGSNGGMVVLNFEGGRISLGIPMKYLTAGDDEILADLQTKIEEYTHIYGECLGYFIFHTEADFNRGEKITLADLQA